MPKGINGRLDDLENAAGGPEEWKTFWQDLDDPNVYHSTPERRNDQTFTSEEVNAIECNKFRVLRVNYVDNWRGPYGPIDDQNLQELA